SPKGRFVVLGTMTGGKTPSGLDLSMVLRKRLTIVGTAMRVRSLEERIELVEHFSRLVMPMFGDGRLKPVVDRVVPMRQIDAAHRALQSNETFGKVVLAW
ncbi:MAG: zinc-binding dehydrogenase, partial [Gemmatimonadota bacterium]